MRTRLPSNALTLVLCSLLCTTACTDSTPPRQDVARRAPVDPASPPPAAVEGHAVSPAVAEQLEGEALIARARMERSGAKPDEAPWLLEYQVRSSGESGPRATVVSVAVKNPRAVKERLTDFSRVQLVSASGERVPASARGAIELPPGGETVVEFTFPVVFAEARSLDLFGKNLGLTPTPPPARGAPAPIKRNK